MGAEFEERTIFSGHVTCQRCGISGSLDGLQHGNILTLGVDISRRQPVKESLGQNDVYKFIPLEVCLVKIGSLLERGFYNRVATICGGALRNLLINITNRIPTSCSAYPGLTASDIEGLTPQLYSPMRLDLKLIKRALKAPESPGLRVSPRPASRALGTEL